MKKPEWEIGAKSEVKIQQSSKWTVDVDDDEVLDDDDFLTEEDRQPAPMIKGTLLHLRCVFADRFSRVEGKAPVKKACANCTCGRAEGKEPVKLTQEMIDNPVTNCGSVRSCCCLLCSDRDCSVWFGRCVSMCVMSVSWIADF